MSDRCQNCYYETETGKLSVRCDQHRNEVQDRTRAQASTDNGQTYYRWAYALNVALAKRELEILNMTRDNPNDWPAGQEWDDLAGSSKSIFLKKARNRAGIDHDEFLTPVRSEPFFDVEDMYGE